jgi:hypothetical protein
MQPDSIAAQTGEFNEMLSALYNADNYHSETTIVI